MSITAQQVAQLREVTGAGMMDAKQALVETNGDMQAAADYLRTKGLAKAAKKADRSTGEGLVYSYIHSTGKIGVLLELQCETDFVARNEAFTNLAHQLALHIAASNPLAVDVASVPAVAADRERTLFAEELRTQGKPEAMIEQIVGGKMEKWYSEQVLLKQAFVIDEEKTVEEHIAATIAVLGENIRLSRFARFDIKGGMSACAATPAEMPAAT
jgi:elongation factor Ts